MRVPKQSLTADHGKSGQGRKVYPFTRSTLNETSEAIFTYIVQYIEENAYSPSVRDIAQGVGIKSTSTVQAHLKRLDEAGRIAYQQGKRRAIVLLETQKPAETSATVKVPSLDFQHYLEVKAKQLEQEASQYILPEDLSSARYVPVIGQVTAGAPILAQESVEKFVPLPSSYFSDSETYFMLRVQGDSMIEAAILDGDLLVVRKTNDLLIGRIVVARIEDEATVKRLILHNGRPYLKPENDAYSLIPFDHERCEVVGQVMQVLRTRVY